MKEKKDDTEDLAECREKIIRILREYNVSIKYDEELKITMLVDNDTLRFDPIR